MSLSKAFWDSHWWLHVGAGKEELLQHFPNSPDIIFSFKKAFLSSLYLLNEATGLNKHQQLLLLALWQPEGAVQ